MTKQLTSRAARAVAVGAIAAALATAGLPALAATQSTSPAAVNGRWINPHMTRLAESSGRLLLERINAADGMIKSGQYGAARNELDSAEDTAGAIETMMPFSGVVDQIRTAKSGLVARGVDGFHDDLISVYAQLDEMSASQPKVAKAAEQQIQEAERQAKAGNNEEVGKDLDNAIETITATAVFLPVNYVYDQVATARNALEGPKPDAAKARRAVQNAEKRLAAVVTTSKSTSKS